MKTISLNGLAASVTPLTLRAPCRPAAATEPIGDGGSVKRPLEANEAALWPSMNDGFFIDAELGWACDNGLSVGIDTRKPSPKAPYRAGARQGRTAALRYRISDLEPNGGTATVTIRVRNRAGKVVKTLRPVVKPVNTALTWKFTVPTTWRTGTYRSCVCATDTAGNRQLKVASHKLVVR